jgi:tetratricopeptide (TPR) repeat protein
MDAMLRTKYLSLFSKNWNHSATCAPFRQLHAEAGASRWTLMKEILGVRLTALDGRAGEALERIELLRRRHPQEPLLGLLQARILCLDLRRPREALEIYARLEGAPARRTTEGKWIWSLTVSGRAVARQKLRDFPAAIEAHTGIISALARSRHRELRLQVTRARLNAALCRLQQGDTAGAAAVLEDLLKSLGRAEEDDFQPYRARAMAMKGLIRGSLEYHREALALFDEVIGRFGGLDPPEIREVVLTAWVNRGIALRKLKYLPDSLRAFDEVVERCAGNDPVEIQEAAAMALIHKAADEEGTDLEYWGRKNAPPHKEC